MTDFRGNLRHRGSSFYIHWSQFAFVVSALIMFSPLFFGSSIPPRLACSCRLLLKLMQIPWQFESSYETNLAPKRPRKLLFYYITFVRLQTERDIFNLAFWHLNPQHNNCIIGNQKAFACCENNFARVENEFDRGQDQRSNVSWSFNTLTITIAENLEETSSCEHHQKAK